jgi:molybdenum cofactor cytidylyltransferase
LIKEKKKKHCRGEFYHPKRMFKMKNKKISSIILSAGFSSRMGSFKPLLKFGEYTAVETIIKSHLNAGIEDIIVVVGYRGNEVREALKNYKVQCVQNENYAEGMFSSVVRGVRAIEGEVGAFFVQPVDIPLVKENTIKSLKSQYIQSNKGIIYPTFYERKGHPPLIDCKYKQVILDSDGDGGLKKILDKYKDDAEFFPTFDEAVLKDMDTPEAYEDLLAYYFSAAPNRKECDRILSMYNLPEHIKNHCKAVAGVVLNILRSLESEGCELDRPSLEAAALIHDISRREKNHAAKGAAILKKLGYEKVGGIISTHMDIEVDINGKITENEILYLADKLVKEDRIMPLKERLELSLKACNGDDHAWGKINNRFEAADKIIKKIEKMTGKGFIYG